MATRRLGGYGDPRDRDRFVNASAAERCADASGSHDTCNGSRCRDRCGCHREPWPFEYDGDGPLTAPQPVEIGERIEEWEARRELHNA